MLEIQSYLYVVVFLVATFLVVEIPISSFEVFFPFCQTKLQTVDPRQCYQYQLYSQ